jgi:glycosyltransferase involved in cell wall biosynthesis
VYLYSEVMPYAIAVMRALVQEFGTQVDCICWDQNKRTPFVPADEPGITFHKRSGFDKASIIQFIEARDPQLIYIVGRMDKLYLQAVLHFKHKCAVVSGSDNQWLGTLKQNVARIFSRMVYRRYFEYVWVPGPRQFEYARRMGYATNKILGNHLTAYTPDYTEAYHKNRPIKAARYPHNIVFAGRFAKVKGLDILIAAFIAAKKETNNNWTLTLIGSGEVPVSNEPFITVKGFMSGAEMAADSINWGVFCLPSTREPWGVVIHEFTNAGLPIIASDSVGAADTLVVNDYNGYIFRSCDTEQLKNIILKIMATGDNELLLMGDRGHELSHMHSPAIAAYSLVSAIKD